MAAFYNQATLSFNGSRVSSNRVTGQLMETLFMTKTALSTGYTPGERVVYLITLASNGTQPRQSLTITDDLGGYTFGTGTVYPLSYVDGSVRLFTDGTPGAAPTVTAGPPLQFSGITVPAEGSVTITYEAEVTPYAPLGADAQIENTATSGALTASATLVPDAGAALSITKTLENETVSPGDTVTYRFLLQNFGGEAAQGATLLIEDTFDPVLQGLSATLGGAAFTAFTYSETTGLFATSPGALTIPAATFAQNADGTWTTTPGTAELIVTGTV